MLTRIALYTTLGLVLYALELQFYTVGFWCVLGLFWAAEHLTRLEVYRDLEQELKRIRKQQESEEASNEQPPK